MRHLAALAVALVLALPARGETLLRLAETASVSVRPDQLVARLRAEAVAGTAAESQQRVNTAMADALARARQDPELRIATGPYNVWRTGPTPQDRSVRWQASQTLELKGSDGAALLSLVGELQQRGLAIGELQWQLAPETARKAREEATADALSSLRGRAEQAAGLIDLRFGSFKEVRLDSPRPPPAPMPRGMMAMAAAAPTPPSAEAEDVTVSATVEADVLLQPR